MSSVVFSISNWNEGGFVVNGNLDELRGPEAGPGYPGLRESL